MGAICSYYDLKKCIKCGDNCDRQSYSRRHCRKHRVINNKCIDCDIDVVKYSNNCFHII